MKLYATVKSDRASKGQGGNERIDIKLTVSDASRQVREIGIVRLVANPDGTFELAIDRSSVGRPAANGCRVYDETIDVLA